MATIDTLTFPEPQAVNPYDLFPDETYIPIADETDAIDPATLNLEL